MRLRLTQILEQSPSQDIEPELTPEFQVLIQGEKINIRRLSVSRLEDFLKNPSYNSKSKNPLVLIPYNLLPVQVPLVALYEHLRALPNEILVEKLGEDVKELSSKELDIMLLSTTLDLARDILQPEHFRGVLNYFGNHLGTTKQIFEEAIQNSNSETALAVIPDKDTLAVRVSHYEEYQGTYLERFKWNEHTLRSRRRAQHANKERPSTNFARCEPGYLAMREDSDYANLLGVWANYIQENLSSVKKNKQLVVKDVAIQKLFYYCSEDFNPNSIISVASSNPEQGDTIVFNRTESKFNQSFFGSLLKRLRVDANTMSNTYTKVSSELKGLMNLGPSYNFLERAKLYLPASTTVQKPGLEHVNAALAVRDLSEQLGREAVTMTATYTGLPKEIVESVKRD